MFKKQLLTLALMIFTVMSFTACAPKSFTTSEKVIYTSVKSLQAAKELRVTALKTIGDMYKAGILIDTDFQKDVIRVGDNLQEVINTTSETILIYYNASTIKNKETLAEKISLYQKIYGEFSDLVMPYVLEHLVE